MPTNRALFIFGGISWMAVHIWFLFSDPPITRQLSAALPHGIAAGILAVAVLRLTLDGSRPRLARTGPAVLFIGLALISLGIGVMIASGIGALYITVIMGEMLTTLGLAALTATMLSAGTPGWWQVLPLLMAPVYFVSWGVDPAVFPGWLPDGFEHIAGVVFGIGWVAFGFGLNEGARSLDELHGGS